MGVTRGVILILCGVVAIWRGWMLHGSGRAWSLYGLGVLALALGAWQLTRRRR